MKAVIVLIALLFPLSSFAATGSKASQDSCDKNLQSYVLVSGRPFDYVAEVASRDKDGVTLKSGFYVLNVHLSRKVAQKNGFVTDQIVKAASHRVGVSSQEAKILHLFENGQVQIEMIGSHGFGNGYKRIVEVSSLEAISPSRSGNSQQARERGVVYYREGSSEYVRPFLYESNDQVYFEKRGSIHSSYVSFEVEKYNSLSKGQKVLARSSRVGGYYQHAKILHLFTNGKANIEMIGRGGYGNGYLHIVDANELEALSE